MNKNVIVSTLALIFLTQIAVAGSVSFKPLQTYPVGTDPRAVAVGDFNHDGKLDLAVVNYGDPTANNDGSVSILFGNGDGTFQKAKNVAIGKNCTTLVAGDWDGDGEEDLALVRPGDASINDSGDVDIFLGNGDGTFRPGQVLTPGKNPSSSRQALLAADLNSDQRLDLVVTNSGDNTFSVLLGNGDGTFQAPVSYSEPGQPISIFIVDLAGNGEKDLAVSRQLNVDIWLSNGDGTFRQGTNLAGLGITTGDFTGDRKGDLVTVPFHICIFRCNPPPPPPFDLWSGNGDGTFQLALSTGQFVSGASDFDGDGKLDLVGTNNSSGSAEVVVSQGNGDGTFQRPVNFAAGTAATVLIASTADVTGDGAPDVVALRFDPGNDNTVSVLVNTGTDFSISASALNPSTLSFGQSASSTVSLTLLSAFDNPVHLACSVKPAQAGAPICSVSSKSVTFDGGGQASATLAINAGSSLASKNSFQSFSQGGLLWLPVAGFAMLGAGAGFSRRRSPLAVLMAAVLLAGLASQAACGGDSSRAKVAYYAVTVTGTSGATQHSTTVNLAVQ